jgi:hypothetical protein
LYASKKVCAQPTSSLVSPIVFSSSIVAGNREWIEEMTDNEFVQKNFYASDVNCRTFNGYDLFATSFCCLCCCFLFYIIDRQQIWRDALRIRREQMVKIAEILASSPNAALMDMWPMLRPGPLPNVFLKTHNSHDTQN